MFAILEGFINGTTSKVHLQHVVVSPSHIEQIYALEYQLAGGCQVSEKSSLSGITDKANAHPFVGRK